MPASCRRSTIIEIGRVTRARPKEKVTTTMKNTQTTTTKPLVAKAERPVQPQGLSQDEIRRIVMDTLG